MKRKSTLVTIVLFLVVAGLGAYLFVISRESGTERGTKPWEPSPLLPENARITRIVLERPDDRIVLEKVNNRYWLIKEPRETGVEDFFIHMLVGDLANMKKEKLVELHARNFAKYQLDPPLYRVSVGLLDSNTTYVLEIGKLTYNQDNFYAKTGDSDTVFLIPRSFRLFLTSPFDAFRSKALILYDLYYLLSFEIKIEDPELAKEYQGTLQPKVVAQKQGGSRLEWMIVDPVHENADPTKVRDFFLHLQHPGRAQVIDVADDNDFAKFGLDKPAARLAFLLVNGQKEEVWFSKNQDEEGKYYVRNLSRSEVIALPPDIYSYILRSHFRYPNPFPPKRKLNPSRVVLEFPRQPEKNLSIVKEEALLYHFEDKPEQKVIYGILANYLKPFRSRSTSFLFHTPPYPRSPYGLDTPVLRIKFYEKDELMVDLALGNTVETEKGVFTYAEDLHRHCLYLLPVNFYEEVPMERDFLITPKERVERYKRRMRKLKQRQENAQPFE